MSVVCDVAGLDVRTTGKASTVLVEHVSVSVTAGEILGVVGETGAGKTLTMRAVLGLLPAGTSSRGSVTVAGNGPFDLAAPAQVRRLLGTETSVVFQNPLGMFDPLVRVREQLIEGVTRRRLMAEEQASTRARELLAQMGFRDPDRVLRLYPHELSGGMAQRVATAMGMMPRPSLLVLDEPTSALDASVRVEVLGLFRRLVQEAGTAAVMVSHDLGLVSHFCDSVAVMYAGRVVEYGPTGALLARPGHPYTAALLGSAPALDAQRRRPLAVIPGVPPAPGAWPSGCVFEPRCPRRTALCAGERPQLGHLRGRSAACHYAEELVGR